jgi:hypothetical protein
MIGEQMNRRTDEQMNRGRERKRKKRLDGFSFFSIARSFLTAKFSFSTLNFQIKAAGGG